MHNTWMGSIGEFSFQQCFFGLARLWYKSLSAQSIHDFNQLRETFIGHFIRQRRYIQDAQAILGCRQREEESLHAFVYRFNKATLNASKRGNNMVIVSFTYGLCPGVLCKNIFGKPPKSRKDMMEKVHRYIKQEKATSEKMKSDQLKSIAKSF